MPHNYEWQTRIKAVEREYSATRQATDRFQESAHRDPTILQEDLSYRDIVHASDNLEGTYIIRLFAEFETGLRLFWDHVRGTNPRTYDLLEGLASMREIPHDRLTEAHAVQEYRNSLVHEREEKIDPISLPKARGYLCRFFSFLPPNW